MIVWRGKDCGVVNQAEVDSIITVLRGFRPAEELSEGEETKEFWEAVGGKGEYAGGDEGTLLRIPPAAPPRLFQCLYEAGAMEMHEIFDYCQEDLDHRFVYVLDLGSVLITWVGAETIEEDRESALDFTRAREEGSMWGVRKGLPVARVDGGAEAPLFERSFGAWDRGLAEIREDPYAVLVSTLRSKKPAGGGSRHKAGGGVAAGADSSPFQIKLKSVGGGRTGSSEGSEEGIAKFPPVKLRSVQKAKPPGTEGASATDNNKTTFAFGEVRLRRVEKKAAPSAGEKVDKGGEGNDDAGVKVEGLFGARLLAGATVAGIVSTPFGTKLKQKQIAQVGPFPSSSLTRSSSCMP